MKIAACINAEKYLFGIGILYPELIPLIAERVREEDFSSEIGRAFGCLLRMSRERRVIDPTSFLVYADSLGIVRQLGGARVIGELIDEAALAGAGAWEEHAQAVRDAARLRAIQQFARRVAAEAGELRSIEKVCEWWDEFNALLTEVPRGEVSAREAVEEFVRRLREREAAAQAGVCCGVDTGLPELDEMLLAWEPGNLVVLSSPSASGKTMLATQIAVHNAQCSRPVYIISLEMMAWELAERFVSNVLDIDGRHLRVGKLTSDESLRIGADLHKVAGLPLFICERGGMTVGEIARVVEGAAVRLGVSLFIVDYLQLVRTAPQQARYIEVESVAYELKRLAKDRKVVILALSQENVEGEVREGQGIFHAADKVFKLRPHPNDGMRKLLEVRKNRGVPTIKRSLELVMDGNYARFTVAGVYQKQSSAVRGQRGAASPRPTEPIRPFVNVPPSDGGKV